MLRGTGGGIEDEGVRGLGIGAPVDAQGGGVGADLDVFVGGGVPADIALPDEFLGFPDVGDAVDGACGDDAGDVDVEFVAGGLGGFANFLLDFGSADVEWLSDPFEGEFVAPAEPGEGDGFLVGGDLGFVEVGEAGLVAY